MLEVEAQLEAATTVAGTSCPLDSGSEAGLQSAQASSNGAAADGFYSSGKGGTWKKFKKMVKHKKEGSEASAQSATHTRQHPSPTLKQGKSVMLHDSVTTCCQPLVAIRLQINLLHFLACRVGPQPRQRVFIPTTLAIQARVLHCQSTPL